HQEQDRQPGKQREPPPRRDVVTPLVEHRAPARHGRGNAQAEEAERRLGDDRGATENVATTVIGGRTFGKRCRRTIQPSLAPSARAAATKSRSRSVSTSPRTIRA